MIRWLIALLLMVTPALAHSWYSNTKDPVTGNGCCGGSDCAVLMLAPGILDAVPEGYHVTMTREQAQKINPYRQAALDITVPWDRMQPSPDGRFHLCIPTYLTSNVQGDFYCFFAPPNS